MSLYFMHLRNGTDETLDPEGIELAPEAVPFAALSSARDCMVGEVQNGRLDFRSRIDVHDEAGTLVHSLAFSDAVEIVGLEVICPD